MFVLPFSLHQISWKFIIRDWVCKKCKLLPASIGSVWTKMWTIVRIQPVPAKFCHYTSVCQSLRPHNTKKTIEANPYKIFQIWKMTSFQFSHRHCNKPLISKRWEHEDGLNNENSVVDVTFSVNAWLGNSSLPKKKPHKLSYFVRKERTGIY